MLEKIDDYDNTRGQILTLEEVYGDIEFGKVTVSDHVGMKNTEVVALTSAATPVYDPEQAYGSQYPLFRFVEDKWKGKGIVADLTDSSFTDVSFWRHDDNSADSFIFQWETDVDYDYIGELTLDNVQFVRIDCYGCNR